MIFVFGYKIFGAKVQFFLGDKGVKELKGVKGGIFCKLFTNFAKKWETRRQRDREFKEYRTILKGLNSKGRTSAGQMS